MSARTVLGLADVDGTGVVVVTTLGRVYATLGQRITRVCGAWIVVVAGHFRIGANTRRWIAGVDGA